MKIGIVGLPNVGKSTLFAALTKKQVDIANYPFCTIEPNTGVVKVPDSRLEKLAVLSQSEKIIPTHIQFVDIAGLVKGAHAGEGLGNQFLSHIREVDAIGHVVRVFEKDGGDIIHVEGSVNPLRDIEIIHLELIYADLATLEKRISAVKSQMKSGATALLAQQVAVYEKIKARLDEGALASSVEGTEEEKKIIRDLCLLTAKPIMMICNTDENGEISEGFREIVESLEKKYTAVALCIRHEADIVDLSTEELQELGIASSGLDQLTIAAYKLLSLITFITTGPKETRAWTVPKGTKAPQAAGVIHSDFEHAFIRAEVINWKDLLDAGSEVKAREKGLLRIEGKEYAMQDGDVAHFRVGV